MMLSLLHIYTHIFLFLFCSEGWKWVKHTPGWFTDWSVWSNLAVEDPPRIAAYSYSQTAGVPSTGAERCEASVSCGLQHAGLPQPGPARDCRQEATLGLCQLRSRTRLPQLGLPERKRAPRPRRHSTCRHRWEGVPYVSKSRPLRALVVGLWGGIVPGRWATHSCFLPLWSCLLRKDSSRMEPNPIAPRHSCLSCCLPFLWYLVDRRAGPHQTHLPGARWLKLREFSAGRLTKDLLTKDCVCWHDKLKATCNSTYQGFTWNMKCMESM